MIHSTFNYLAAIINQDEVQIPKSTLEKTTLGEGLQIFFAIASAVALLIITIAALNYVLSRGDSNAIKKSKETIIYAAIGLLVTIGGYGIVTFVFNNL